MRPGERSPDYLHSLDGWRAVAISLVLIDHAQRLPSALHSLQGGGGLGVRIFFAISGLLICTRLLGEEATFGSICLRGFYVRRAFRILPASLTYLAVLALLGGLALVPFERSSWWSALFFYRNFYTYFFGVSQAGWFTSHFWSLSVEEHFYFVLPAVLVQFPRHRRAVLAGLVALSLGGAFAFVHKPANAHNTLWTSLSQYCLVSLLLPALVALSLGDERVRQLCTRLLPPWLGVVLGLVCVTRWIHPFATEAGDALWSLILKSTLFPLMLLSTVLHPTSWLTRLMDTECLRFVGRISYSLYLWQALFLTRDLLLPGYPLHRLQHPAVGIACTVLCALASYYWVETPMIAFGRRFTPKRVPVRPRAEPVTAPAT